MKIFDFYKDDKMVYYTLKAIYSYTWRDILNKIHRFNAQAQYYIEL